MLNKLTSRLGNKLTKQHRTWHRSNVEVSLQNVIEKCDQTLKKFLIKYIYTKLFKNLKMVYHLSWWSWKCIVSR